MSLPLPLRVDEVDRDWLDAVLSSRHPGIAVAAIEERTVIPGTATKILLRVAYARNEGAVPLPRELCVKGGFNDELRPFIAYGNVLEADFYAHFGGRLAAPLPRCWFAAAEPERGQGIVILDNLLADGASFPDPLQPWGPERTARALDALAAIHGQSWGAQPRQYPWLRVGTWIRDVAETLLSEAHWARMFERPGAPELPPPLRDRDKVQAALREMWRLDALAPRRTLCHSDAHMGNTYLDAAGRVGFLDWQGVALAPGWDDVANIVGGSLAIDDRRKHERDLLRHYLDAFAAAGGPRVAFDDAWLDYRRYHMHGILWAVTPPSMQDAAKVGAMAARHLAAIVDHDVVALLGR